MYKNNSFLTNQVWAICEIGKENHMPMDAAPDMFCENLETYVEGEPVHYAGANVDYALLSKAWKSMSAEAKADAKVTFRNMWRDIGDEIASARRVGSRAKVEDLAFNYTYVDDVKYPDYVLFQVSYDIHLDSVTRGVSLAEARDAKIAELEAGSDELSLKWQSESSVQHQMEVEYFDSKVVTYDGGLNYAIQKKDKDMYLHVLATR